MVIASRDRWTRIREFLMGAAFARVLCLVVLSGALLGVYGWGQVLRGEESSYAGHVVSVEWTDSQNALGASDGSCSTTEVNDAFLFFTDFDFDVPVNATITGIEVTFTAGHSAGGRFGLYLLKEGTRVGQWRTVGLGTHVTSCVDAWTGSYGGVSGTNPLWQRGEGPLWTATDINHSGFGVRVASGSTEGIRRVDAVKITVYYTLVEDPPYCTVRFGGELLFGGALDTVQAPSFRGEVSTQSVPFHISTNMDDCVCILGSTPFESSSKVLPTMMSFATPWDGVHTTVNSPSSVILSAPEGDHEGMIRLTVIRDAHNDPEGTYTATVTLICVGL